MNKIVDQHGVTLFSAEENADGKIEVHVRDWKSTLRKGLYTKQQLLVIATIINNLADEVDYE